MGLIDELSDPGELLATARRRALQSVGAGSRAEGESPWKRLRAIMSAPGLRKLTLESNALGRRLLFAKAEQQMMARTGGHYPAAGAALRAVRAGVADGEDGYGTEAEEFAAVLATPEAAALISIFFATQALKKESGATSGAKARAVEKVGIVGGGLMGAGIGAVNVIRASAPTVIKEIDDAGVARAIAHVEQEVDKQARRRRLQAHEIAEVEHLLEGTTDYAAFENVDLVVEAVFEDLELKRHVLADVEANTPDDTILATNTSSIPIADIAVGSARPQNVIGMHYFSPVERMPLLEVIVTDATSADTTATCVRFGRRQGKTVIVVNDGTGFYTTRILAPYAGEVLHLLRDGASIEDIDGAMVRWGFPVGPVTLSDEVGIDVGAKIAGIMESAFGARLAAPEEFGTLVADGRHGRKSQRGFYRYEKGKKLGVDPTVYDILGVGPSGNITAEEIQDRLALQLINEAARCLEEGILRSARDGDIGAVMGLGFPPFRGGPFFYVDQVGADQVVSRMDRLVADYGSRFEPAAVLRERAGTGEPFRD
jgi:3-hydroxyacyl-CoA dehydrogenase/enoyl-CoA hydratase/3-hydroxybutyryl-CoA epimerase